MRLAPAAGLSLPVLDRVPKKYAVSMGEVDELRAARALLTAGVADPTDWAAASSEPGSFLQLTVTRWIAQGYGDMVRHSGLAAVFCLDAVTAKWYLGIWVNGGEFCLFGPTLRLLNHYHPRLPRTFIELFTQAAFKCVWAYGPAALREHYEQITEMQLDVREDHDQWEDEFGQPLAEVFAGVPADPDGKTIDRIIDRKLRKALPAFMFAGPLGTRRVRSVARAALPDGSLAAELMQRAIAVHDHALPLKQSPQEWEAAREAVGTMADAYFAPWPAFLTVIDEDDQIVAAYDQFEHDKFHSGMDDPPTYVIAFDLEQPATLRRLRDRVVQFCRYMGHAMELARRLPSAEIDPAALVNTIGGGDDNAVRMAVRS